MAIPTYAVIADSEIDPESPLTSSLMFRLRDNILALLGIDPATPSPTMNIGESVDSPRNYLDFGHRSYGYNASYNYDSDEEVISEISGASSEHLEIVDTPPQITMSGGATINLYLGAITVPYVTLAPQAIEIRYRGDSTSDWTLFTSPNDNTYRTLLTWGSYNHIQVKSRITSTQVFLQFRCHGDTPGTTTTSRFNLAVLRREYRSKNAATA
jgi:hypothetical protein